MRQPASQYLVPLQVSGSRPRQIAPEPTCLSEVVNRVGGHHERVTVTVHGTPRAVLIAPADLESLEETVAILADRETIQRLGASDIELAAGQGESEADLAAAMQWRTREFGA